MRYAICGTADYMRLPPEHRLTPAIPPVPPDGPRTRGQRCQGPGSGVRPGWLTSPARNWRGIGARDPKQATGDKAQRAKGTRAPRSAIWGTTPVYRPPPLAPGQSLFWYDQPYASLCARAGRFTTQQTTQGHFAPQIASPKKNELPVDVDAAQTALCFADISHQLTDPVHAGVWEIHWRGGRGGGGAATKARARAATAGAGKERPGTP
jgi:hypothetical protein